MSSASASGENEASCVDNDNLLEEFFNSQTSACPHAVSLQPEIDEGTLWGDAAHYGYSDDGRRRYQSGRVYTAAEKLEELIVETHARRVRHCSERGIQLLRLGRDGARGHLDRGVQDDSTDLLQEKALAQPGPSARMCSPGIDCTVFWQCVVISAQTKITAPHTQYRRRRHRQCCTT